MISILLQQHIRWLDVTVDETLGVGVVDRLEQLAYPADRAADGKIAAVLLAGAPRIGTTYIFHRKKQQAFRLPHLVERHDVRMVQHLENSLFAEESLDDRLPRGDRRLDRFQGDESVAGRG